jgi:hypothetical protein
MRCTIHDAFKGGVGRDDLTAARGVDAILNAQSFPEFKVPILWDTKIGRNWADMQELPSGA